MITSRIANRTACKLVLAGALLQSACKEAKITETPVAVASIDVSQPTVSLQVGQNTQVTATPKSSSGESLTARSVQWSSGNNLIATVSASGVIVGMSAGNTTVEARSGGATRSIPVTVSAPPSINLSATTVSFTAPASGNPAPQAVSVTNGGGGSLVGLTSSIQYDAGQATGWLSAALNSSSAPSTLTLQVSVGSLSPATYGATVTIASAVASSRTVRVTLVIPAIPAIGLSASAITFNGDQNATIPAAQTVTVSNTGSGTVTGLAIGTTTYTGGAVGWLTASLSGTTTNATLTLRPSSTALPVGTYTATVPITAANAVNSPQTVTVTYNVRLPAPVLSNLTFQQVGAVNACVISGVTYTEYRYTFNYTDANGDVPVPLGAASLTLSFVGVPSGDNGTGPWNGTISGTGSSGTINATVCWRYDTDTSIIVTWTLTDASGRTSAPVSVTQLRPTGAVNVVPNVESGGKGAKAARPGGN